MNFFKTATVEVETAPPELTPAERYERCREELREIKAEMVCAEKALFDCLRVRYGGKIPGLGFVNDKLFVQVNLLNKYPEVQALEARWARIFQRWQGKLVELASWKKAAGLIY